jgi:hypothetical protein
MAYTMKATSPIGGDETNHRFRIKPAPPSSPEFVGKDGRPRGRPSRDALSAPSAVNSPGASDIARIPAEAGRVLARIGFSLAGGRKQAGKATQPSPLRPRRIRLERKQETTWFIPRPGVSRFCAAQHEVRPRGYRCPLATLTFKLGVGLLQIRPRDDTQDAVGVVMSLLHPGQDVPATRSFPIMNARGVAERFEFVPDPKRPIAITARIAAKISATRPSSRWSAPRRQSCER